MIYPILRRGPIFSFSSGGARYEFLFPNALSCGTMCILKGGAPMLQRAYVELTNRCNLHCDFCPGTKRPLSAMDLRSFETAAEKLRPHTRCLYLHVMGEPLLYSHLAEALEICRRLDFRVYLTTNGVLLPGRLDTLLAAPALYKVSVSLHSYEGNTLPGLPLEDYVRGCVDSGRALAEGGVLCALRLWNRGGRNALNDTIESLLSAAAGTDVRALPRDGAGHRRLLPNLFLEEADRFFWPGDPDYRGPDAQFCYGLRRQLAVLCDGTVVPCCLDGEGRLPLGNIFTQRLEDILSCDRAQAILRGFDCRRPAEPLCRRCGFAARFNVPL